MAAVTNSDITVDTTVLNRKLADIYDALIGQGQDASNLVRDEARLLLKQIIKLTPPKNLAQGRNAVLGDLLGGNALSPKGLFLGMSDQPKRIGRNTVVLYVKKDGAVGVVRSNYRPGAGQHDLKQWHYQYRSSKTGRTFRQKPEKSPRGNMFIIGKMASKRSVVNKYVRTIQARVGRAKAAWGTAYRGMGGKLPSWIAKHLPTPKGIFVPNLMGTEQPSVIMGSSAPGVRQYQRVINSAVRIRGEAMGRKLRLILSGYAKDVATDIRVKNKFRKSGNSEQLD